MKLSLGLKVSNSLSLTPQLQQAIRLLQLSSLELESSVDTELDSVFVSCDFSVLAAPFPLHAVNNNAMQSVKIERNVLFVFINNCSLK